MGALVALLGLRIADPQPLILARMTIFDSYQRLAPRPYVPAPVRVIEIDNESLDRIGQWPWPRTVVARMVRRLQDAGAAAIVFDMIFAEPDRTSPVRVVQAWPQTPELRALAGALHKLPDHDDALAEAVAKAPVVLGMALGLESDSPEFPPRKFGFAFSGADPAGVLPNYPAATRNLPVLEQAASGIGVLTAPVDADGIVRRMTLLVGLNGTVYPSLAVEALRVAQGARSIIARSTGAPGENGSRPAGLTGLKVGHVAVPTNARGEMWLHLTRDAPSRAIPAWRVLQDGAALAGHANGNVVLIGASAPGLGDVSATPVSPAEPGVMVHAQALEQMLLGRFLERPDWAAGAELAGLMSLGGVLILVLMLKSGAVASALAGVAGAGASIGASWFAYESAGMLFDPLYPAFAAIAISVLVIVVRYVTAERERRAVRAAFGRYVAPAVVERLAEHPDALRLGGEMRDLTVMFCDIRGFTGIVESMSAEELTHFVNRYMTPMTDVILEAGGTIDKYMGDAIMAFWNAPLNEFLHQDRASRAALALHHCVAEQSRHTQAGTAPLRLGIGLGSGPCCVGNFGSDRRFDYSALGDTVNLASRLEQQCKFYGVDTIVAESTWEHVPDLAYLELDLIQVMGKTQAVRIFALVGDEALATERGFTNLQTRHDAALAAYRRRDWVAATRLFKACQELTDGTLDRLYGMYEARLAALRADPPGEDWDGVRRPESK